MLNHTALGSRGPKWTKLQQYGFQLGYQAERRYSEAALIDARRRAEQEAARARGAAAASEAANTALRDEIQRRVQAQNDLEHLAKHDPLTGLSNRLLFGHRLQQELARARRDGSLLAVLFIDLDHFKDVNDTLGHHAGDELLVAVADRLRRCVRAEDTIARLGGDEFAVIQTGVAHPDVAASLAERILAALAEPVELQKNRVFVGGSIGITLFPTDAEDAAQLQKNADVAMYRAKNERRNTYCFFSRELDAEAHRRAFLEQQMRQAIQSGEFLLNYQPKANLEDGRLVGAEVLLRWQHSSGLISPAEFIPIAESSGFIGELGEWVLREACAQLARWRTQDFRPRLAINLSPVQFRRRELAESILAITANAGISPDCIELEVTETAIMRDVRGCIDILRHLRGCGFTISIDDFGTGYSSLSYLGELPVDRLKIDRSFVAGIEHKAAAASIVRAVIGLGHNLGLNVVAEGIETVAQREFLRALACDEGQGYLFGRPAPAATFAVEWHGPDAMAAE